MVVSTSLRVLYALHAGSSWYCIWIIFSHFPRSAFFLFTPLNISICTLHIRHQFYLQSLQMIFSSSSSPFFLQCSCCMLLLLFLCCYCGYRTSAFKHTLSHSFFQMAVLHRSGKHFTVYFISKSALYFISIVLKLLQKTNIIMCVFFCYKKFSEKNHRIIEEQSISI